MARLRECLYGTALDPLEGLAFQNQSTKTPNIFWKHSLARKGVGNYAAPGGESNPATGAMTMCNARRLDEAFSLCTIPVWVKASEKKIKVNATDHALESGN